MLHWHVMVFVGCRVCFSDVMCCHCRWLVEETHKLERQQKIQQQKLLELQQVNSRVLKINVPTTCRYVHTHSFIMHLVCTYTDSSENRDPQESAPDRKHLVPVYKLILTNEWGWGEFQLQPLSWGATC